MSDPLLYTQGMTDHQRLLFMSEYNHRQKNGTTGVLLALFLGGLGAHRFYMGQIGWGIVVRAVLPDRHPDDPWPDRGLSHERTCRTFQRRRGARRRATGQGHDERDHRLKASS